MGTEEWRKEKPTRKQRNRLRWWAAKLGRTVPPLSSRGEASDVIEEWLADHPELEDAWQNEADRLTAQSERREDHEVQIKLTAFDVDEWRGLHGCNECSRQKIDRVLRVIGYRRGGEPVDKFTARFFSELKRQSPETFVNRGRTPAKPLAINMLLEALVILVLAAVVLAALLAIW